ATQTDDLVRRLRQDALVALHAPETADVGGSPGLNTDLNHELQVKLIPVVLLVLVLSFFVLLLFFRSVLIPLKALLMNLASVIAAFAFGRLLPIKELGFGLAAAVLIDATIIRVMLVPATMRLLGDWNWWLPKWLDKRLPNVSLEGLQEPPGPQPEPQPVPAGV